MWFFLKKGKPHLCSDLCIGDDVFSHAYSIGRGERCVDAVKTLRFFISLMLIGMGVRPLEEVVWEDPNQELGERERWNSAFLAVLCCEARHEK